MSYQFKNEDLVISKSIELVSAPDNLEYDEKNNKIYVACLGRIIEHLKVSNENYIIRFKSLLNIIMVNYQIQPNNI